MNFNLINNDLLDINNNMKLNSNDNKELKLSNTLNNFNFENLLELNLHNKEKLFTTINCVSNLKESTSLDEIYIENDNPTINYEDIVYDDYKTISLNENKNIFINNNEDSSLDNDEKNSNKKIKKSENISNEKICIKNTYLSNILNSNIENINNQNIISDFNNNEITKNAEAFKSINFDNYNNNLSIDFNDSENLNLNIMKSFEENTLIELDINTENLLENNEYNKENVFNQVKDGLLTSLSGSRHIKLQLKPQNLGSVGVNIKVLNGKINLEFIVDNSFVENVINQNINQLESILNSSGLLVINEVIVKKRIDNKNTILYNNILKSKKEK